MFLISFYYYKTMAEYNEGDKETWNMAQATLKRLNGLLNMSSYAEQKKDMDMWFGIIMDIRRNLAPFLKDTEFKEVTEKLSGLPNRWRLNVNRVNPQHYVVVHKTLDEVYIIFINCMKDKGLLMPKPLDSGKSIIGM